ncbi:methyltransferase domain-containing protein [Paenibacillus validus]|uniref:Methyltransferase domain-containing protein n=1 Tax=Paenibacillus validus TaxID=44253 RepID=A0A7X2ZCS6_9BACL|nr:methyltransferase domain-containing protein [Paenibacillus validus]
MNCRICDWHMELFLKVPDSAREVSKLYDTPTASKGVDLDLYKCNRCGHYQIPDVNIDSYYEEYLMTASYSEKMQDHQKKQVNELFKLCKVPVNFLEIGCGDGNFMDHSKNKFSNVVGVEPSKTFFFECEKKGLQVINEYLTRDIKFNYLFNAFVSRQVFEHLPNPFEILSVAYDLMDDDAVGLIEVPNAQKMLSEGRYFDLFSDHLNYFTSMSLCYLAERANFNVIKVQESFQDDYLEIYLRKKEKKPNLNEKRVNDFKYIIDHSKTYNHISAWGAGAKAQAILTVIGQDLNLKHIFDSDPHKHNKYICNSSALIVTPSFEAINDNELIIIFAVSYQDEIISLLRNKYMFQGDIMCLGGEPCILKISENPLFI